MDSDEILIQLGKQIRSVRKAKGYTQEETAHHADLARSYYGDIERGTRNVSALNLIAIAHALGVQVGELFPEI